ncbi:hypothetical protein LARI1_G008920 [Lachnellula arida]|uniref:BTB domain-containing protein n=1 Tax=Lachnellula arida TaxID=1316785 RepID=A0A8T9B443_9HELO|nr:hypothetical protein LARI1_G008920 [Lachnellula arida]
MSPPNPVEASANCGTSNEIEMSESEEGLEVYAYPCPCRYCSEYIAEATDYCEQDTRILKHTEEVSRILIQCPNTITLVVGPRQTRLKCHKALLAFKSEYFDAAFFGNFASRNNDEFRMELEDPKAMSTFVSWLYTGRISSTCVVAPAVLWVLGDRLRSPGFTNTAMHFIFADYTMTYINAETAEYIYDNTSTGSKLRTFVKDLVLHEGPLSGDYGADKENAWRELIRQGGDLVIDVALEGSFTCGNSEQEDRPHDSSNHSKYLEPITTRPIEDFLEGKPREGTRKI